MEECCLCGFAVKSTEEMEYHIEDSHSDIFNFKDQQLEDTTANSNFKNMIQVSTNYQFKDKLRDSTNRQFNPELQENLENSSQKQVKKEKIISTVKESYTRSSKSRLEINKIQLNDTTTAFNNSKTAFSDSNAAITHSKSLECSGNKQVSNSRNKNSKSSKMLKSKEIENKPGMLKVVEKQIIDSNFSTTSTNLKVHQGKIKNKLLNYN